MVYAEMYGVEPHTVADVPLLWWIRWENWITAKNSRAVHERTRENKGLPPKKNPDLELYLWAMKHDKEE